jgi:hypothetical protein
MTKTDYLLNDLNFDRPQSQRRRPRRRTGGDVPLITASLEKPDAFKEISRCRRPGPLIVP